MLALHHRLQGKPLQARGLFSTVLLTAACLSAAQVSFTGPSYTQNFDGLASTGTAISWTDNSTLAGWYIRRVSVNGVQTDQYNAGDGSGATATAAIYSFGTTGSSERAIGAVTSTSADFETFGVRLRNNTDAAINSFTLSYTGEQWRNAGNASQVSQSIWFSYSLNSVDIGTDNSVGPGTANYTTDTNFTRVSSLDFTSLQDASGATGLDGNAAANRKAISATVNLSSDWNIGSDLWIRWVDLDLGSGLKMHGMGVDDVTFGVQPAPEPASMAALGLGALALLRRRKR